MKDDFDQDEEELKSNDKEEENIDTALKDVDAEVLLVNYSEMLALNPEKLAAMTPAQIFVYTVNGWAGTDRRVARFTILRLDGKK